MFTKYTEAQYRELDYDKLVEQRDAVAGDTEAAIADVKAESDLIIAEFERREAQAQLRKQSVSDVLMGRGKQVENRAKVEVKEIGDRFDTEEYRKAWMDYTLRRAPMPEEFMTDRFQARDDAVTYTTDVSVMVPTTVSHEFITKMDEYGSIYSKVRKTNIPGAVDYPIVDLAPEAFWIDEDKVSDYQKLTADETVSFKYYQLECRVAQSLLSSIVTFADFQRLFVPAMSKAMVKKLEEGIIKGTGTKQMLGIVNDTRVPAANVISMSEAELGKWADWHKKVKAAMKKSYRNGEFVFNQASFDAYIDGMVDQVGQPVARVNYGINGEESYRFMGKTVETLDEGLISDFSTTTTGDVIGLFVNWGNYCINTNEQIRTTQWVDHDTNQVKTKLYGVFDGKLLDPYGVLVLKKGASA